MAMTLTITIRFLIYREPEDSRIVLCWMAIREDELAAAASGLNTVTTNARVRARASTAGWRASSTPPSSRLSAWLLS